MVLTDVDSFCSVYAELSLFKLPSQLSTTAEKRRLYLTLVSSETSCAEHLSIKKHTQYSVYCV